MLETKQLRILKTIVDVGSFTRAAEHLGLSQSAVSQQVRALEDAVGVPLLLRAGKGTRPTPAGELLLQTARQVLTKLEEVERLLGEQGGGRAGVLRVCAPEPACAYLMPPVLAVLRARFPRIEMRVANAHPDATLARLAAGDVDVGLVPVLPEHERVRVLQVGRDELVAIVPPDHRWAAQRSVDARDFEDEPLVLYDRQSPITALTLEWLLDVGVFPRVALEIEQLEGLKRAVRSGIGVAAVPAWSVRDEVVAGELVAVGLGQVGLSRAWALVYVDSQPQPPTLRAFVQVCGEILPGVLAGAMDRDGPLTEPVSPRG
jgi:molybdate transport repressor ModE-like protein